MDVGRGWPVALSTGYVYYPDCPNSRHANSARFGAGVAYSNVSDGILAMSSSHELIR